MKYLIDQLHCNKHLERHQYVRLLMDFNKELLKYAASCARNVSVEVFGTTVYLRGLIEITNYCRNNCYYCGIRCSNHNIERYRLSNEEILDACYLGDSLGIKTFVLQGGENAGVQDETMEELIKTIRNRFPDTAITLSLGEKSEAVYRSFFVAGANRYLLRHETANREHYHFLHPQEMSFDNRLECLRILKSIGYQIGTGMMIGSPGQTAEHLADDILFISQLAPRMIGMGPYIPQKDTSFAGENPGSLETTLLLISIFRLMFPRVWMPATTSLATLNPDGYERGIRAGANVIMLNLTPFKYRSKYAIYDHKRSALQEAEAEYNELAGRMAAIGYHFGS